jgi:hypothetical protein
VVGAVIYLQLLLQAVWCHLLPSGQHIQAAKVGRQNSATALI